MAWLGCLNLRLLTAGLSQFRSFSSVSPMLEKARNGGELPLNIYCECSLARVVPVETTRAKKPQEQFLNELTHSAKVELTIRNPTFIARSRV